MGSKMVTNSWPSLEEAPAMVDSQAVVANSRMRKV